jgi:AcrR family transcriptional regulator
MPQAAPKTVARSTDRRAEILEAAARLFAERGFHATSTRDICVAVGMSAGNLYHWFPSKQAIIAELLQADAATHLRRLDDWARSGELAADAPQALIEFVSGTSRDEVSRFLDGYAAGLLDAELAPIVRGADQATRARFVALLEEAGIPDAESVATIFVALIDGLLARRALEPDRNLHDLRAAITAVTDALLTPRTAP